MANNTLWKTGLAKKSVGAAAATSALSLSLGAAAAVSPARRAANSSTAASSRSLSAASRPQLASRAQTLSVLRQANIQLAPSAPRLVGAAIMAPLAKFRGLPRANISAVTTRPLRGSTGKQSVAEMGSFTAPGFPSGSCSVVIVVDPHGLSTLPASLPLTTGIAPSPALAARLTRFETLHELGHCAAKAGNAEFLHPALSPGENRALSQSMHGSPVGDLWNESYADAYAALSLMDQAKGDPNKLAEARSDTETVLAWRRMGRVAERQEGMTDQEASEPLEAIEEHQADAANDEGAHASKSLAESFEKMETATENSLTDAVDISPEAGLEHSQVEDAGGYSTTPSDTQDFAYTPIETQPSTLSAETSRSSFEESSLLPESIETASDAPLSDAADIGVEDGLEHSQAEGVGSFSTASSDTPEATYNQIETQPSTLSAETSQFIFEESTLLHESPPLDSLAAESARLTAKDSDPRDSSFAIESDSHSTEIALSELLREPRWLDTSVPLEERAAMLASIGVLRSVAASPNPEGTVAYLTDAKTRVDERIHALGIGLANNIDHASAAGVSRSTQEREAPKAIAALIVDDDIFMSPLIKQSPAMAKAAFEAERYTLGHMRELFDKGDRDPALSDYRRSIFSAKFDESAAQLQLSTQASTSPELTEFSTQAKAAWSHASQAESASPRPPSLNEAVKASQSKMESLAQSGQATLDAGFYEAVAELPVLREPAKSKLGQWRASRQSDSADPPRAPATRAGMGV